YIYFVLFINYVTTPRCFFFQAEDGIRDRNVTGVQTCALPISLFADFILSLCELIVGGKEGLQPVQKTIIDRCVRLVYQDYLNDRSEERRVGKESKIQFAPLN